MSRPPRIESALHLLGVTLLLGGLVTGCQVVMPRAEYVRYREVRTAETELAALQAKRAYLNDFPDGAYADAYTADLSTSESATYESLSGDEAGTRRYLEIYPNGEFADQARSRLAALSAVEARRAETLAERAAVEQARAERQEVLRRTWVSRFVADWAKMLVELDGWGEPIAEVARKNSAFSQAFGRRPKPRCSRQECVKYYVADYALKVVGSTRLERTMQIVLRLRLGEGGTLRSADLLLPGWGFSRWQEIEEQHLVADNMRAEREAAQRFGLTKLRGMLADLGARGPTPLDALPEVTTPVVGPTGETIDTTVAGPGQSVPEGRSPATGQGSSSSTIGLLGGGEPEYDMSLSPIEVGAAPATGDRDTRAEITALPAGSTAGDFAPAQAEVFQLGGVRVTAFAVDGAAPAPAFDGLRFEPVTSQPTGDP